MSNEIKKGERFQVGEVWISPKGALYLVKEAVGYQAVLRLGIHGMGQRKVYRNVDATDGWSLYKSGK